MSRSDFLDEEMIAKIRAIQIRTRHLVNDVFQGEYQSAFKGRGLEFEEVREYQPGDDVRSIDWNVTARSGRPFIKTYRDERELTVVLAVDVSASARFGTLKKFKNEVAAEVAALLAYTALKNSDKIGLLIFSDQAERYIPPKKGRAHVWRIIREILAFETSAKATSLKVAADFLNRVLKRRALSFMISDFQDEGYQRPLISLARRHELIAIQITDQRETELPDVGYIELEDAETAETIVINTGSPDLRSRFAREAKARHEEIQSFFRSSGIDLIKLNTHEAYMDALLRFFHTREGR